MSNNQVSSTPGMSGSVPQVGRWDVAKVLTATFFGMMINYYDFGLAIVIAPLVWASLYYSSLGPVGAGALAIMSAFISLLVNPIGSYIFGHIGDRLGRRGALMWTLVFAGIADLGIALTPGYAAIGVMAPALIIIFRILFGFGIGGEYGNAFALNSEYATPKRRALFNSVTYLGVPAGLSTAFGVALLALRITGPAFFTTGWRIAFIVGVIVVVVGVLIRYRLMESPLFAKATREKRIEKYPASLVLKKYWKRILMLSGVNFPFIGSNLVLSGGYMVLYLTALGSSPTFLSFAVMIAFAVGGISQIPGALLADRIGRRPVILGSAVALVILTFPLFLMLNTAVPWIMLTGFIIVNIATFFPSSATSVLFTEQFPTSERASGAGLSFQLSGFYGGILAAIIVPAVLILGHTILGSWPYVAVAVTIMAIISVITILGVRETKGTVLQE